MKIYIIIISFIVSTTLGCVSNKKLKQPKDDYSIAYIKSSLNGGDHSNFIGQVKDLRSGESMPFVGVVLKGENKHFGTWTDSDGNFTIKNVPRGTYVLTIRSTGYEDIELEVKIENNSNYTLEIKLFKQVMLLEKPVIYLYPVQKQNINVKLNYQGILTHSYPAYSLNGWNVTAEPDGTLWDENAQEYYALFWEGNPYKQIIPINGFVVPGKETAAFLEDKLSYLGLNRREANEFIMYWLPRLENNPYNLIHFASNKYEEQAALVITPNPETIIRIMMLTQPLQSQISFPIQDLSALKKSRKGFTVVEWGGSVVNDNINLNN